LRFFISRKPLDTTRAEVAGLAQGLPNINWGQEGNVLKISTGGFSKIIVISTMGLILALGAFIGYSLWSNPAKETKKEVKVKSDKITVAMPFDTFTGGFYPEIESYDIDAFGVMANFYETLVTFDENFKLKPLLAEGWDNPNDTTWRFHLRKNVKFHNGEALKASDVKFSINLAKESKSLGSYLSSISDVVVVDENTVEVKTASPNSAIINRLTDVFILNETVYKANGTSKPVGTGPYIFSELKAGEFVKLAENKDYWGQKPYIKEVVFKPIEDNEKRTQAILNREADIVFDVPPEDVTKIKENNKIKIAQQSRYGVLFLVLDNSRVKTPDVSGVAANPFLDKKVRQAISLALDRKALAAKTKTDIKAVPAYQAVTPYIFGYNTNLGEIKQDIPKAKQLLAEAGYKDGFTFKVIFFGEKRKEFGEELKNQLSKIGINLTPESLPPSEVSKIVFEDKNASSFMIGWYADSGDATEVFEQVLSGESLGLGAYKSEAISKALSDAVATTDLKKKRAALEDAGKAFREEMPIIPLYTSFASYAYYSDIDFSPRVDGRPKIGATSGLEIQTIPPKSLWKRVLETLGL